MDNWTKSPWEDTGTPIQDSIQEEQSKQEDIWRQVEGDLCRKTSIGDLQSSETINLSNAVHDSNLSLGDAYEQDKVGGNLPSLSLKSESHSEDEFGDFDEAQSPTALPVFQIDPHAILDELFTPVLIEQRTSGPSDSFPTHTSLKIFERLVSVSHGADGRVRRMRFQDSVIYSESKAIVQNWIRNPIVSTKGRKVQTAAAMFGWDRVGSDSQTKQQSQSTTSASFSWSSPIENLKQQNVQSVNLPTSDEVAERKIDPTETAILQQTLIDESTASYNTDLLHIPTGVAVSVPSSQDEMSSPVPEISQPSTASQADDSLTEQHLIDDDFGEFISSPQLSNISPQPSRPPKTSWFHDVLTPVSALPSLSHSRGTSEGAAEVPRTSSDAQPSGLGLQNTETMPVFSGTIDLLDKSNEIDVKALQSPAPTPHQPTVLEAETVEIHNPLALDTSPPWDFSIFEQTPKSLPSPIQSPKANDPVSSIIASIPDLSYMLL